MHRLKLPHPLEKALLAMNFTVPTPIQAQAIPVALTHRDMIGCAQSGTGKTAAYSVPVVARLLKLQQKTALILVPTPELATQVFAVIQQLTAFIPDLKSVLLIGGMPMPGQARHLQAKPRILVATPGRIIEHLERGTVSLSSTEILVLDEADRMLEMGSAPQLNQILRFLPKTRQTLFFSTTFPHDIEKLSTRFLKDPVRINAGIMVNLPRYGLDAPSNCGSLKKSRPYAESSPSSGNRRAAQ